MINANELRIGNWVSEEVLGNVPILEVHEKSVYVEVKHMDRLGYISEQSYHLNVSAIFPIPITPDILNKIDWDGYVKLHINSYFSLDDVGHLYYSNDYTGININYLHQLQNIYFSLTNNELNIEL